MKGLREKFRKNSGFTLIEMLIVVAIIAILIMVSIPMISSALERAKVATDSANERSAMATAFITYMTTEDTSTLKNKTFIYYVDDTQGKLDSSSATSAGKTDYGQCSDHAGEHIIIAFGDDDVSEITITWSGTNSSGHVYKVAP